MAIFAAVVDASSFSIAARRLDMPKSTVSFRIARLEERLGVQLLRRTTRVVHPTELGRAYYERCTQLLAEVADMENALQRHQGVTTGTLRLAAPIEFGMHVMGSIVARFKNNHPQLRVDVELTSRHIDLVNERFDLAVRIGRLADSSLVARKVLSVERQLFAAPRYLAARGHPSSPGDLDRHDCLHFVSPYVPLTWSLERRSERSGGHATGPERVTVAPNIIMKINNLTMIREAALTGLGIAILPRYMCLDALARGTLALVLEPWSPERADVFVVHAGGRHVAPKIRAFIDHFSNELHSIQSLAEPRPF